MTRLAIVVIIGRKKEESTRSFDTGFERNTVCISFKISCVCFFEFFEIASSILIKSVGYATRRFDL